MKQLELMKIFYNDSEHESQQMFVERQLLVMFERFEIYDNKAFIYRVVMWIEINIENVDMIIRRVITAIFNNDLQRDHVR